jgi:hypothetical protein
VKATTKTLDVQDCQPGESTVDACAIVKRPSIGIPAGDGITVPSNLNLLSHCERRSKLTGTVDKSIATVPICVTYSSFSYGGFPNG